MSDFIKIKLILAGVLLASFLSLDAQSLVRNFEPLQSQGEFPKRLQEALCAESFNGFVRSKFFNGQLLYGTPLNQYVDSVADVLLQNDFGPLRDKLQFYVLKTTNVNAHCTENGAIVVTVGLLAQISNESELAYVLAHEVAHYEERHLAVIKSYRHHLRERNEVSRALKYQNQSRECEWEADEIGLKRYFLNSPYSTKALDGLFDVLFYSDLPLDDIEFPRSEVETDFYRFPDDYFLNVVNPVGAHVETMDTLKTHPNTQRRRQAIARMLAQLPPQSENDHSLFVQPQSRFEEIRNLARLECVYLYLLNHQYDQAIYNTYLMRQLLPDNDFLDYVMAAGYYGIAKHKNYGNVSDIFTNYQKVRGEMQQVSHWLMKAGRKELTCLAFRKCWEMMQKHPESEVYAEMARDLMTDIVVKNKMRYIDFCDYPMFTNVDSLPPTTTVSSATADNKYDRLRQKKMELIRPESRFNTVNYMFADIHRDSLFVAMMGEAELQADNERILNAIQNENDLDVSRIVVAPISYNIVTKHNRVGTEWTAASNASRLNKHIKQDCRQLKLDAITYTTNVFQFTTESYNCYSAICAWQEEYRNANGMKMHYHQAPYMEPVFDALNCRYALVSSVQRSPSSYLDFNIVRMLLLNCAVPYIAPFTITNLSLPRYETAVQVSIADFLTGETISKDYFAIDAPMSRSYVDGFVYQQLAKFKKK